MDIAECRYIRFDFNLNRTAALFAGTILAPILGCLRYTMLDETGLQLATVRLDGRHARTLRTRQRLIKAYLGLLWSAKSTPTGADIAKRAGNSTRSLYDRFPNRAELNQAAATYVMAQEAKALFVPPGSDRRSRMEHCIQSNLKAHERWWPLWRAYMLSPEHAESLSWTFERLRNKRMKEFEAGFHPELSALPASAQRPTAIGHHSIPTDP